MDFAGPTTETQVPGRPVARGDSAHPVDLQGAVAKYLSLAGAAGLDWASTVELDEASLERQLMGDGAALRRVVEPDYPRVHIELRRKGVTLMLLWGESRAANAG